MRNVNSEALKTLGATVLKIDTFLTKRIVIADKWIFVEQVPAKRQEESNVEKGR